LFIGKFYQQGKIKVNGFSLLLGSTSQYSKLWIGVYVMPQNVSLDWIGLNKVAHWQVPMSNILANGVALTMQAKSAILDSGTSLIYLPTQDYDTLMK
jgi:hypothetical protein